MSVPIRTVRPGDPISAAVFNEVVDALNALGQISGVYPIEVDHDAAGVRVALAHQFKAWLFRIQTVPSVVPRTSDNVPYYNGTRIRLDTSDNYAAATPEDVQLYDPLAKDATVKLLTEGTWVLATFDTDAGRWHIVRDPYVGTAIVRFRLDATLSLGGSANAHIRKWDPTAGGGAGAYVDGDAIVVYDPFGIAGIGGGVGEWQAPNGYYGFAIKLADKDQWQILYMEHQALFVAFTLTENMGASSAGQAACTFDSFWQGRSTGTAAAVFDRDGNHANFRDGDKGIANWDNKLNQYVIITEKGMGEPILFYLDAPLTRGGSAAATIRLWNVGLATWQATGASITAYDSSNLGPAKTSDLGVCFLSSQSGRYEIISLASQGGKTRWAKAYDNTHLDSVAKSVNHYVLAQECTDDTGTTLVDPDADPFELYLPSNCNAMEPNVQAGAVLAFEIGPSGRAVATGGGYLDACRGSMEVWYSSKGSIKFGWAICDGLSYENGATFTTPDLTAKFVLHGSDPGTTVMDKAGHTDQIFQTGGNNQHTHGDHGPEKTSEVTLNAETFIPSLTVQGSIEPIGLTGYGTLPSLTVTGSIMPADVSVTVNQTGTPYAVGYTEPTALSVILSGDPITVDVELTGYTDDATTGVEVNVFDPNNPSSPADSRHPDHGHQVGTFTFCVMPATQESGGTPVISFAHNCVNDIESINCGNFTQASDATAGVVTNTDPDSEDGFCSQSGGSTGGLDHRADVDDPGHRHSFDGTASVTFSTDDLGISLAPNPHDHYATLPVTGFYFTTTVAPHTHGFDLRTYSAPITVSIAPHTHAFELQTYAMTVPTTIDPNPHYHLTPTLKHSNEWNTPTYYALAYIMRAY